MRPKHVVLVLLDSLNRHLLGAYGSTEFDTPVLDAFAKTALRFTRHVTGSLPCMPARHDLLVGALDFLWRPWGSIEAWEEPITHELRAAGVTTMLVTDHPHLFETGGENYHCAFGAWDYVRGHETDPWKTRPDPSWVGAPALPAAAGTFHRPYDVSRTWFREETDFPGPRTMRAAADWIRTQAPAHDRFLLFVDEFDPHEPFDVPAPWAGRFDPTWEGERLIWPPYATGTRERGVLTERQVTHLRANYGEKLAMIDHWFGRLLQAIDDAGLRDDTAVIVCTDHGHFLGEHDCFGKPLVMQYEEMGHVPLLVRWPGRPAGDVDALTTTVDLHATLCDVFGVTPGHRTHGASLLPLLDGSATSVRDWAIGGIWGNWVQVTDGRRKYARAPVGSGFPLAMWSNRWSTMPLHAIPQLRLPRPDRRAGIAFMPGSDVPVLRQPFQPGDMLPFWGQFPPVGRHHCFDVEDDPRETHDLVGTPVETAMRDLLRAALDAVDAPPEQLERLGLA